MVGFSFRKWYFETTRTFGPLKVPIEETQAQPQASYTVYHPTIVSFGEEIPSETILVNCRTSRVFCIAQIDRNTSQDLVSKPTSQIQEVARIRIGKVAHRFKSTFSQRSIWVRNDSTFFTGWTPSTPWLSRLLSTHFHPQHPTYTHLI